MCILSYLPPSVPVDEEGLLNGGIANPDGHGWAIADGGELFIGKSMDLVAALDGFIAAREAHPNGHALFHSRYATHGTTDTFNVHPFKAGHSDQTVVAHNGILPASIWPAKGDDRSDTHRFAQELLSTRYRRLDKPRAMEALTNWIGNGNKLVILTVDPRYSRNAYIVNETAGNWDTATGIWHSNYDYEGWGRYAHYSSPAVAARASKFVSSSPRGTLKTVVADECYLCGIGHLDSNGYCEECRSCGDCLEHIRDCFCWQRSQFLTADEAAQQEYEADGGELSPSDISAAIRDMYQDDRSDLAEMVDRALTASTARRSVPLGDVADDIRADAAASYAQRYGEEYDELPF